MAKYDYVKVRVNEEERAMQEGMVKAGQASTLTDAIRKLAFAKEASSDSAVAVSQILKEVSVIHTEITKLITKQLAYKELYEPDIMRMEQYVVKLGKIVVKLSKAVRKGM